jgi:hypothetical protein
LTLPVGTVTGYRIYRNGVLIATPNGTLLHLDENLNPGCFVFVHEVVAVKWKCYFNPLYKRTPSPANPILISVTEVCEGQQI